MILRRTVYYDGLNWCRLALGRFERPRLPDSQLVVATLVLAIGISGLLVDLLAVPQPEFFNIHLIFGLAMAVAITGGLAQKRHVLGQYQHTQLRLYARDLSRRVYLMLYVLAAARLGIYLYESLAAASDSLMPNPVRPVRSMDDFQIYIVYGIVPLWVIRSIFLRCG